MNIQKILVEKLTKNNDKARAVYVQIAQKHKDQSEQVRRIYKAITHEELNI